MWSSFGKSFYALALSALLCAATAAAATNEAKLRIKTIRDLSKQGSGVIAQLLPYLHDPDIDVRAEAVKAITDIGTDRSLEPLIQATSDNEAEVQIRAVEGLVNFYLPGYVKTGLGAHFSRATTAVKSHFTDTNDQVIDPYVHVRPEVIAALGRVTRSGVSMDARASAARALGILRGRAAEDDLIAALRSKDSGVMYESLIALQKIRDRAAGPRVEFVLRDLDEKVQIAAIDTTGLLQDHGAIPTLRDILDRSSSSKVRKAALSALAMMPDQQTRPVFLARLNDRDDDMRTAAAEGLARLKNPADVPTLEQAFNNEKKMNAKLAMAFALVSDGQRQTAESSPLQYIVYRFNSGGYRDVARAYLTELSRDPQVRTALYQIVKQTPSKDEKIGIAQALGASGGQDSVQYLEWISKDPDSEVAEQGIRALRILRARIG